MNRKSIAVQDRNDYIAPSSEVDSASQIPLCVDLDGTLVKTDLLYESFFLMLKLGALFLFNCASWLLKGKAYFKHQIAARAVVVYMRISKNLDLFAMAGYVVHRWGAWEPPCAAFTYTVGIESLFLLSVQRGAPE